MGIEVLHLTNMEKVEGIYVYIVACNNTEEPFRYRWIFREV